MCTEAKMRMKVAPRRSSVHLCFCSLLLGRAELGAMCSRSPGCTAARGQPGGRCRTHSGSGWGFYLQAAQNLGVTNRGWSVIPFPVFSVTYPLDVYLLCMALEKCSTESGLWPWADLPCTGYRWLKRFVCMFSILICPFDKIRAICINNSLSFKLTQKFPSSRYCCQICFSQNSISPGASSEYNSKWNAR